MTDDVVVLAEGELSDQDVTKISSLYDERTTHHLLVTTQGQHAADGGWSFLGVSRGDTFGSPTVARRAGAAPEPTIDPGEQMAHGARRLRETGRTVTTDIAHGDLLAGGRALAERTGSDAVVIVARRDTYQRFALPEWQRRAAAYLMVSRVHIVEQTG
jgi:hypothetical protein